MTEHRHTEACWGTGGRLICPLPDRSRLELHVDEDQDHRVPRWDHHSRPPRPDGVPGPAIVLAIVGIPLLVLILIAAVWIAASSSGQTTDPVDVSGTSSAAQSGAPR